MKLVEGEVYFLSVYNRCGTYLGEHCWTIGEEVTHRFYVFRSLRPQFGSIYDLYRVPQTKITEWVSSTLS